MSLPKTYRKIVVADKSKGFFKDQCRIVEVEFSPPGAGEVTVELKFVGVQASDVVQNSGGYGPLASSDAAVTFDGTVQVGDCGCEGSGVVVAVGSGVEGFAVGQAVLVSGFGISFREYVNVPATTVIPVPEATAQGVAIPISALTAVGGLEIGGRLQAGEKVLVTAATGGTGQFAVQWAKMKGCFVVGTCSTKEKAARLKEMGCDETINYKEDDVAAKLKEYFPTGIDVVYECVGGSMRDAAWANMAVFGRLVVIGSVGQDYTATSTGLGGHTIDSTSGLMKSASLSSFYLGHLPLLPEKMMEFITGVFGGIASGKINVFLDSHCESFKGLEGVFEAQAYMRTGKNMGKIYVTM